jgi:hypothetical protein
MPNWDEDSPQLRENLAQVLKEIARRAELREIPTVEWARGWQRSFLEGLSLPDARYVGAFRGEPGLENIQVKVGTNRGATARQVAGMLRRFEATLLALLPIWTRCCRSAMNWMPIN